MSQMKLTAKKSLNGPWKTRFLPGVTETGSSRAPGGAWETSFHNIPGGMFGYVQAESRKTEP